MEGFEAFEIVFQIPTPGAIRGCASDCAAADSGEERQRAMARFIADHLKQWPFAEEISEEALAAIEQDEIFYGIFNVIAEVGDRAKN